MVARKLEFCFHLCRESWRAKKMDCCFQCLWWKKLNWVKYVLEHEMRYRNIQIEDVMVKKVQLSFIVTNVATHSLYRLFYTDFQMVHLYCSAIS